MLINFSLLQKFIMSSSPVRSARLADKKLKQAQEDLAKVKKQNEKDRNKLASKLKTSEDTLKAKDTEIQNQMSMVQALKAQLDALKAKHPEEEEDPEPHDTDVEGNGTEEVSGKTTKSNTSRASRSLVKSAGRKGKSKPADSDKEVSDKVDQDSDVSPAKEERPKKKAKKSKSKNKAKKINLVLEQLKQCVFLSLCYLK